MDDGAPLKRTGLHSLHVELGARMVPFAGFDMPVQYEGINAEHEATRTSAGLFDVSHMGVVDLVPADGAVIDDVIDWLEALVPASISGIGVDRQRYTMLTNADGGVIDDLIVTRFESSLRVVLNASRVDVDLAHLGAHADDGPVEIVPRPDLSLVALQGPLAVEVLAGLDPSVRDLWFMHAGSIEIDGTTCPISRSGYTGEDGFEIAMPTDRVEPLTRALLADGRVTPAGLGARDTLRLEAGLCLYGHELDETITPVEADLVWSIQPRRRREGGFLGSDVVLRQIAEGAAWKRVGLRAVGKRPVRDGAALRTADGAPAGTVSSGGFGPTVGAPVAMARVPADLSPIGTELIADVRGKDVECVVADLPFSPHSYARQPK